MSQQLNEYSNKIVDLLKGIQKKFKDHIIENGNELGFTMPQLLLIHELFCTPEITLNDLSKRLNLSKSTVSGIVDRLEKQGVLKRIRPDDNRRIVKIFLTEKIIEKRDIVAHIKTEHLTKSLEKESDSLKIISLIDSLEYLYKIL
ncbi:MAG: hypothetical protein A2Y34_02125 [Spirochaetes bacterium GWC1_27_15]|nr:MAG: hypothetical protein A2Z98_12315 [Spirochaetes bacterium GWB1_27_13]OHD24532.1 MAG: hypothetical protein A2Y34_02125 [Spirochaetes bacterium GWC1_27_15]